MLSDFIITEGVLKKYKGKKSKNLVIPFSVTSIGERAFYECVWLTSVTIPEGVTSIGNIAFYGCSNLASVTIPESVTSIGNNAFTWCSSLTSVTIPESVTSIGARAFSGCSSLASVTIPESVASIGRGAFVGCSSLASVTIPESVTSIGARAFSGCSSLTSVTIPESVTSIGDSAFYECSSLTSITIPEGVTSIGHEAYSGCRSLTSVTIPESVTSIGNYAFYRCYRLTSVTIPKRAMSIGSRAFAGCSSLANEDGLVIVSTILFDYDDSKKEVIIPESVTSIGDSAFYECRSLTSVTIPESVTSIGDCAFYGCSSLTSVTIPIRLMSIGSYAFTGCKRLANEDGFVIVNAILFDYYDSKQDVIIPEGVTRIDNHVFSGCSSLTSVTIPESVTSIGERAFSGCSSLTSVTIPERVMSIGERAFSGCSSLTSIIIPSSVKDIGKEVFSECGRIVFMKGPREDGKRLGEKNCFALFKIEEYGLSFLAYASSDNSDNLIDFAETGKWADYDGELINNGPKYKYRLPARLVGAVGRLLEPVELTDNYRKLFMELARKNVKKYIPLAEAAVCPELVKALFDLGIVNAKNEKAVRKLLAASGVPEISVLASAKLKDNNYSAKTESEKKDEPLSLLEQEYICKLNNIKGDSILKNMNLIGVPIPAVYLADGTQAPDSLFRFILASYGSQTGGKYYIDQDADDVAKLISYDSLYDAMESISKKFAGPYYPSLLPVLCRFGSVQQVKSLIESWKEWGDFRRYKKKGRDAQEILIECMILSDTREAVLWLEKWNRLAKYAAIRGLSKSEVYEKYLFDCGFDENGKKIYDLGTTTIEASLTTDLKIELYDTVREKTVRSIPKNGTDPANQKKAANEVADLRRNLKKIAKIKNEQLFMDYIDGNRISPSRWEESYAHNPLLQRIASLLVWEQGNNTFIQTENGPVDNDGKKYTLTDNSICVAHPMEMQADEVTAWQKYFIAHNLKQPFAQIWEPVYRSADIMTDRYNGIAINPHYLKNQRKRGIEVEWYDGHFEPRNLSIKGFDVEAKDAPRDESDGYELKLQITSIQPHTWNRRSNTVIAFLDRITIYGRIKKDDLSVMSMLDGFTLEQISDFINVALKHHAVNLLAALMDYKNEHFSGYDHIDSFLLEDL